MMPIESLSFPERDLWNSTQDPAPDHDVVLATEIRLLRNLQGRVFPQVQSPAQAREVLARTEIAVRALPGAEAEIAQILPSGAPESTEDHRAGLLLEREMIDEGLTEFQQLYLAADFTRRLAVNTDDHLCFVGSAAGLDPARAERRAFEWEQVVEKTMRYAASVDLGYLTARIAESGPGMSARVWLHLPGLHAERDLLLPAATRGVDRPHPIARGKGFTVALTPLDAVNEASALYCFSTKAVLGEHESEFLERTAEAVGDLVRQERTARDDVRATDAGRFDDGVCRSLGVLSACRRITFAESLGLWSLVRMGAGMEIVEVPLSVISGLCFRLGPAHVREAALAAGDLPVRSGEEKGSSKPEELTILEEVRSRVVRRGLLHGGL